MLPFIAKPGEIIEGLGFDFSTRLATGETITSSTITADTGISVVGTVNQGTLALANISVSDTLPNQTRYVYFTVIGTLGSKRKASRQVLIRAKSE